MNWIEFNNIQDTLFSKKISGHFIDKLGNINSFSFLQEEIYTRTRQLSINGQLVGKSSGTEGEVIGANGKILIVIVRKMFKKLEIYYFTNDQLGSLDDIGQSKIDKSKVGTMYVISKRSAVFSLSFKQSYLFPFF